VVNRRTISTIDGTMMVALRAFMFMLASQALTSQDTGTVDSSLRVLVAISGLPVLHRPIRSVQPSGSLMPSPAMHAPIG
jgi:hypothetical protein